MVEFAVRIEATSRSLACSRVRRIDEEYRFFVGCILLYRLNAVTFDERNFFANVLDVLNSFP
jgi:hypothetical protein